MSSETPADRPSASSDASAEARPRRAIDQRDPHSAASGDLGGDRRDAENAAPRSPSTPVRFGDRLASRRNRGERSDSDDDRWTWDLPPKAEEPPRQPAAGPDHRDPDDAVPDVPQPAESGIRPQPAAPSGDQPEGRPDSRRETPPDAPQPRPGAAKQAATKQAATKQPAADPLLKPGNRRFKLLQGVGPRAPREEIPDQSHLPASQRTDLAVRITDLSITYRTSFEKRPTLRQAILRLGSGQRAVREINALQNLSFEVKTGSSVGIIGRNGAGKSTLMRAMAGILPPTSGTIEVWGRASTLLALGVGFNNALSGRENIILGGLAAGLSLEEVEDRANEIAEWTELGDFIDMPMRTYSSGMGARVAFAVAVHMEPDILMVDEGLSTGDAHFRDKASAKMTELRDKARAMFLVSHGLGSIKELCDDAIWIDKGRLMARGEPAEVVEQYLAHLKAKPNATAFEEI